jgi:hypothetical protein
MSGYDNNGNYTRHFSWQVEDANGKGIVSDDHDTEDNEFALGLNQAFLRNGSAPATGTWDMAGHVIGGLGTRNPTPADNDAVTYGQLTGSTAAGTPAFNKGINIAGADLNGRVTFSSLTGANGLSWAGASMSFLARINESTPTKTRDRLVINNDPNGAGTDVAIFDDVGNINATSFMTNLSYDTVGQWRTISPGWGARLSWVGGYRLQIEGMDAATVTDPYVATTLAARFTFDSQAGNSTLAMYKKDANTQVNMILSYRGTSLRWRMDLGNGTPENTSSAGSDFGLYAYKQDGATIVSVMTAARATGRVAFPNGISGVTQIDNAIEADAAAVLAGSAGCYLRPVGRSSVTGQFYVATTGDTQTNGEANIVGAGNGLHAGIGMLTRAGISGAYGANRGNIWWSGSAGYVYIDNTALPLNAPCDYRIKQEVKPLASTWDKVKALRPISFQYRDYDIIKADGVEHWGFTAHELQEALLPSAATGEKDAVANVFDTTVDDDGVEQRKVAGTRPQLQSPNPMAIIAALTASLQEAMARIEALEARLPA